MLSIGCADAPLRCVLGLDIGTTSTIGILLRLPDTVVGLATRPVVLSSPHPAWAEEDPLQWWDNVCAIAQELLAAHDIAAADIAAIGVTGMLPALVLLDSSGTPLRPSIQQSDGRCGAEVDALRRVLNENIFLRRTGNGINQQLVAPRLRWIERHEPATFARIATVFGSYDYINFRLTGERRVEANWALEAGFVDLASGTVDPALIELGGVEAGVVPDKIDAHALLGHVTAAAAAATGLAAGTPVIGGAADMIASALGAGVVAPGDVLIKLGGSVDILTATARARPDRRLFLDYHLVPGLFMPNGCMSTGGSALNWFVATFAGGEAIKAAAFGMTTHAWLDQLAAACPAGSDDLIALPYFLGEKTPLHDPRARGVFEGLTLSHGIGHLWRALLEAYAFAIRHHVEVLREIGHPTLRFVVSDGGAASRLWLQIIADCLGEQIRSIDGHPGSCLGVAWAAAVGVGLETDWVGIGRFTRPGAVIVPDPTNISVYDTGYRRFRRLHTNIYL